MIPYGKQYVDDEDIQAVVDVLHSEYLTTGPVVERFEQEFARYVQATHAVALSSGTAALHAAMFAAGIGPGDEVIVPAITFAATANAILYQGGTPVFADVNAQTLNVDPADVAAKVTGRTRAIVVVDYAGQPCDYDPLRRIAIDADLILIADSCHSLGGFYRDRPCGSLADMHCFSLHPVKAITCGEGGVVTTCDDFFAATARKFRNHGIATDHRQRASGGHFEYDMQLLGFNYRLTDFQSAMALSQLAKLDSFIHRRNEIAQRYSSELVGAGPVRPLAVRGDLTHAYHLFVVRCGEHRDKLFRHLRNSYITSAVHYRPVYQHSYYQNRFPGVKHRCPRAEQAYREVLSLPIFPAMRDFQVQRVVQAICQYFGDSRIAA
jgi:perosamine synthetase